MRKIILSIIAYLSLLPVSAQEFDFFDAGLPDRLFVLGVRAGVNTSNLSDNFSSSVSDMQWTHNQWKAGVSAGIVCDINIRNFLTLQPGFFLQRRNHDYLYMLTNESAEYLSYYEGNRSSTYFQVPILASLRMDLTSKVQWQVDFGPYFLYGIGGDDEGRYFEVRFNDADNRISETAYENDFFGSKGQVKGYDWGFKMGTGIVIMEKYYVGVHYEAGCRNVLKQSENNLWKYSGHNKAWQFSIGYNF